MRRFQLRRWLALIVLNAVAQGLVLWMESRFFDSVPNLIFLIQVSLGLPLSPVVYLLFPELQLSENLEMVPVSAVGWATMVECGLRRFIDRPAGFRGD